MAAGFPRTAAEVTAPWLTEVLRKNGVLAPGERVSTVEVREIPGGFGQTSDTVRLAVGIEGEPKGAAQKSIIAKFSTTNGTRRAASLSAGLYRLEVGFYSSIAPNIQTRTPVCYFGNVADGGEYFALLLEDFPGHRVGDETAGCSYGDARKAVVQIARLHAPFWGRPDAVGVITPPRHPADRLAAGWDVMMSTFGDHIPDGIAPLRNRILASAAPMYDWMTSGTCTVVHGDFRLDNLLFGEPGTRDELVVLDWQAIRATRGIQDFTYLVSHCMDAEERRRHEFSLLQLYVDTLARLGVAYDMDQARSDYIRAALYLVQYVIWITGVNINSHERAVRRKQKLVERAFGTLLDHDAFSRLPR
jgi:hypothetical protein